MKQLRSEGEMIKWALGDDWNKLHPDIKRRFNKNPEFSKSLRYKGILNELTASFWGKIIAHIAKPLIGGALIPHSDYNFPVDIQVYCKEGLNHVFKHRVYQLNGRKPIEFISHMEQHEDGSKRRLREYVGAGLGMFLIPFAKDGDLHFRSDGYFWEIGKLRIPLPSMMSPGKTRLSHTNIGSDKFSIRIDIDHVIFGKMFTQEGTFEEVHE